VDDISIAAPAGSVVEVEAEGEASVGELKQRLLDHFGLLDGWPDSSGSGNGSAVASTRLRIATDDVLGGSSSASMSTHVLFGEVLADEALSLDEVKVKDGFKLVLEKGARAGRDEVTLRFKAIVGNDPATASFAFPNNINNADHNSDAAPASMDEQAQRRPPHACRELEVTVKANASVLDLKVAMCKVALAEGVLVLPPQHAEAIVTAAEAPDTTTAARNATNQAQAAAAKAAKQAAAAEAKVATLQGKKKKDARAAANAAAEKAATAAAQAEELRQEEVAIKAAAAAAASAAAEDPAVLLAKQRRLRLTNWAEEPGALVEETKEGNHKAKSTSSAGGDGAAGVNSETVALHQTASALTKAATEAERLVGTLQGKRKKEARVAAALAAEKAASAAAAAAAAEARDAAQREAERTAGGWAARAASLAPLTVKEALLGGGSGGRNSAAGGGAAGAVHDVLWLEEGRVPLKGELKVSVLLWQPCAAITTVPEPPPPEAEANGLTLASTVAQVSADASASSNIHSVQGNDSRALVNTQHRQYSQAARSIKESCYVKVAEVEVHATNSLAQLCAAVALQLTSPTAPKSSKQIGGSSSSSVGSDHAASTDASAAGRRVAAPGLKGAAATLAARVADMANRAEEGMATDAAEPSTKAAGAASTSALPVDGANTATITATSGAAPANRGGVSATMAATAAAAAAAAQHLNFEASATSAALEVYFKSGARCFRLRELRVDEWLPGKWLGNDTANNSSSASPSISGSNSGSSSSGCGSNLVDASAVAHARSLGLTTTLERLQVKTERPLVLVPVSIDNGNNNDESDVSGNGALTESTIEGAAGGLVQSARAWMPSWLGGSDDAATTTVQTTTAAAAADAEARGEHQQLSGLMRLPAATKSFVDVWITRRGDGKAAFGVASPLVWPPKRCLVTATSNRGAPTFDDFLTAVAAAAGVPCEHAIVARHSDKASWVVLAADMTSSRVKKGSKKNNNSKASSGVAVGVSTSSAASGSNSGTTEAAATPTKGSGGARSVTQSPFYVQHGDLIGILDRRVVAANLAAEKGGAATVEKEGPQLEGAEVKEERWWEIGTPATSKEWARAFDTPADVEVREVAAAAAAAKSAAAAASGAAGGASRNDGGKKKKKTKIKEIALDIGTAGGWDEESEDDDDEESSDDQEESDEE